MNCRNLQYKL